MQRFVRETLPELILAAVAIGFLVLFLELAITRHNEGAQIIGIVGALAGTLAALLGFGGRTLRFFALLLFALVALAGAAGTAVHVLSLEEAYEYEEYEYRYSPEKAPPPPLAPLGLSGLALIGALAVIARSDEK